MSFSAPKGEDRTNEDYTVNYLDIFTDFQTESEGEGTTEDKCMMIRTSMH
jgi:hypothetical protein